MWKKIKLSKEETWFKLGFKKYGIDKTEDLIKNHPGYTKRKKEELLEIRKKLIQRLLWKN